ncbi:MAG: hypothetical protein KDB88_05630 [Flavobacteriales bacterium]|nr:hypothetical protein [Flavobacteriales bacterium]
MKNILLTALALTAVPGLAQSENDLVELVRSDIRADMQAIVAANMEMSEEESKAFWPMYDEYALANKKLWDSRLGIISDYAGSYESMTDEVAQDLLARAWASDKELHALLENTSKKMMKVLPASRVARFNMIVNRLQNLISLQLASELPLMPASK